MLLENSRTKKGALIQKIALLTLSMVLLFGCGNGSSFVAASSDSPGNLPPESLFSVKENAVEEELTLIGEGFISDSGEQLEIVPDIASLGKEYLALTDGRRVCDYFVDYRNTFLVFYDPGAQTVEPFFLLQTEFEGWTSLQVELGQDGSLLILWGNAVFRYDLASKEVQPDFLKVSYPEGWRDGALVAVKYDKAGEQYIVAFTQWEDLYWEQNHPLYLSFFDLECREIGRYNTNAPVLRDSFAVWSVPFLRVEGEQVVFRTFSSAFGEQYPELEKAGFGIETDTEALKRYAKLAQESYYEYAYHWGTDTLSVLQRSDPFQDLNWKLARYAEESSGSS